MHGLLTDDHALDEVAESDHFLPEHQRSKPQECTDVNLGTSRLAADAPLLGAGLLPFSFSFSFSDVDRANYIRGMAAFYELGSMYVIEQTFIH